jgi:hypothetical protein
MEKAKTYAIVAVVVLIVLLAAVWYQQFVP